MTRNLLGNPQLTVTDVNDVKEGLNHIVVDSVQFGNQEMIMEKDVAVEMKDGEKLYVNIFRPNKEGQFPVVMSADTYGKDNKPKITNMGAQWPTLGPIPTSSFTPEESPDPGFWVPQDYVVVKLALRGSSKSNGVLSPWSKREAEDYYEVIEWAAKQEWSNGNVGTNGVSYLAVTQWWVASLNPPHLKAMIPWEGLNDMYREVAFHGGIPDTGFFRFWVQGIFARWTDNPNIEDLVQAQKDHPLFDDYWKQRQAPLHQIKTPLLACASWSTQGLHNRGSFEGFKQASSEDKWLYIHGRKEWESYYARENLERQKAFFDYYLKEEDNDWKETPTVTYEVRDQFYKGEFKTATAFPLPNTNYTPLYLNAKDLTLNQNAVNEESSTQYDSENEQDDVRFSYTFDHDTELVGNMNLKLWVSTDDADDMDLFAGIKKLDRRGNEVHFPDFNHIEQGQVATGWLRASHRELDQDKSTIAQPWHKHEQELKLNKGDIVPVEIELLPSGTRFKQGETLVVVVKGSEVVKGNSTPGMKTRYEHEERVNKGLHHIHTGGQYDSQLIVPVTK
ncbi:MULTISPECIES: CocE/NonD family hydrolase [Staphylococcus]|uniref:CocE/NonD family hydrolase n=1 Tax=Staphylococcus warneri TaxID=1292 RepID=A0ABS9ND76_STAWA|nr:MULTISPECIES: CocE/NonD family hydrolase [Staphylococcus]MCC8989350.1 CocE/NonD family hydrolase [Staphylococcus sp.]PAK72413.1 acyl esterase [Staphylococcus pasteuri]SKR87242.1 hydrolase, CocE/NonD family protein [Mycobacteroides abscessus subsp. abscessus]EGG95977.1 hydrolase CocE/NonD family protein [Staphylococcus warneri VCU121]KTW24677.1 acyl esterase [Staphylococcus warneri]